MASISGNAFVKFFFFGNYFYGICAVALSVEASLQQRFPLNNILWYVLIFSSVVLFYTYAYISETTTATNNIRLLWYRQHKKLVVASQLFFTAVVALCVILFVSDHLEAILNSSLTERILFFSFPSVAALYYGIDNKALINYKLRNIGWLKPFVIGFVWAGVVAVYPVLFYDLSHDMHYNPTLVGSLLSLKNFMFVSVLCIMFDIKDYSMDYNQQLKTFVVKTGLRKTIYFIIIPLCFIGLGSFIVYGLTRSFSAMKITLNVLPFLMLIAVAYTLQNRKSILYYLIIIDGLMVAKAICGSIAMIYF
ncbi:MAG: hypothetical protein JJE25_05930 [Bacteroidia bacterium]|nr:hypothetical protein [Bacteroidia bacterium]